MKLRLPSLSLDAGSFLLCAALASVVVVCAARCFAFRFATLRREGCETSFYFIFFFLERRRVASGGDSQAAAMSRRLEKGGFVVRGAKGSSACSRFLQRLDPPLNCIRFCFLVASRAELLGSLRPSSRGSSSFRQPSKLTSTKAFKRELKPI